MKFYKILGNKSVIACGTFSADRYSSTEEHLTFKMVFNGEQHFKLSKKELVLFPDSFICLPPGTSYESTINENEPVRTLSVSISPSFLAHFQATFFKSKEASSDLNQPIFAEQFIYPLSIDMSQNMQHLYRRISEQESDELVINEYLYQCLYIYYTSYHQDVTDKMNKLGFARTTTRLDILKRLNLAKEFMSNNYNKKYGLEEVAAVACLSPNHLLRTFKKAFGMSPYQYLSLVRLQRAKILLETAQDSVNEIVFRVGFESTSTFIKLFKANFKVTPLKHRKAKSYRLN